MDDRQTVLIRYPGQLSLAIRPWVGAISTSKTGA